MKALSVINLICFAVATYAGFNAWAFWIILPISLLSWVAYALFRPGFKASLQRENAIGSPVTLLAALYVASCLPVAVFYGLGRLLS